MTILEVPALTDPTFTVDMGRQRWNANDLELARRIGENNSLSVLSYGALGDGTTDDTATINDTFAAAIAGDVHWVYFPGHRTYVIKSMVGAGTPDVHSLYAHDFTHLRVTGGPGAKISIQNGATSRCFLFRTGTDLHIEGLELSYDRTDGASADGITVQNCSQVTIDQNYIHGHPHYGIAITEASNNWGYRDPLGLAFDAATKKITSPSAGIQDSLVTGLRVGDIFFITGSLSNDSRYTVAAVDPGHAWVQVVETLVNESALSYKSIVIDNDISFTASTRCIMNENANGFGGLVEGMQIQVVGSALNDGIYTIEDLDPANDECIVVEEALITEAAGATVAIQTSTKPAFSKLVATACDDLRITRNRIVDIGAIGIEPFPKIKSGNELIADNFLWKIGIGRALGVGIKSGQGFIQSIVRNNIIDEAGIGIAVAAGDTTLITQNQIINFYAMGIASTLGRHPRLPLVSTMDSVHILNNQIVHTTKRGTQTAATPRGTPFISTRHVFSGINLNGIPEETYDDAPSTNLVPTSNPTAQYRSYVVEGNTLSNLPCPAMSLASMLGRARNIAWINNKITDCSQATTVTSIQATGSASNNTLVITGVSLQDAVTGLYRATTAGWRLRVGVRITSWTTATNDIYSVPPGTVITAIDPVACSITLSGIITITNSVGSPLVGPQILTFQSDLPEGLLVRGNRVRNTRRAGNGGGQAFGGFRVRSTNGIVEDNSIEGGPIYPFLIQGSGTVCRGNQIYDHYSSWTTGTSSNAPFLFDSAGTYIVKSNHLHSSFSLANAPSAWCNANGAQSPGAAASVIVYMDDENDTGPSVGYLKPLISGLALPLTRSGTLRATATWDPANLATAVSETKAITVTGAQVGDVVQASLSSLPATGWTLTASVTATNTVTAVLVNNTGGTVNVGSGTLSVIVRQL